MASFFNSSLFVANRDAPSHVERMGLRVKLNENVF
jgi:hypothetical protein